MSMWLQHRCAVRAMWQRASSSNISSLLFLLFLSGLATLAWLLIDSSTAQAETPPVESKPVVNWNTTQALEPSALDTLSDTNQLVNSEKQLQDSENWLVSTPSTILAQPALPNIDTSRVFELIGITDSRPNTDVEQHQVASNEPSTSPDKTHSGNQPQQNVVANDDTSLSGPSTFTALESSTPPGVELPTDVPAQESGHLTSGLGHLFGAESTSGIPTAATGDRHRTSNALVSSRSLDVPGKSSFSPD